MIATLDGRAHLAALADALEALDDELPRLERWAAELLDVFAAGGRLLVAGNGGSAAEAQHLTAELVGRFERERRPFSALALHAETSSATAIANDFGAAHVYARLVNAHGRPGDVLLALSTSGRSENILAAAATAVEGGLTTWALTGSLRSPLARTCDDVLAIECERAATVQEAHLVAIHLLCGFVDAAAPEDV